MSRAKASFVPTPRVWTAYQVACFLNMSEEKWRGRRAEYEALGFPKRDEFLGGWDADAIERWLDVRSGLASPAPGDGLRGALEAWRG